MEINNGNDLLVKMTETLGQAMQKVDEIRNELQIIENEYIAKAKSEEEIKEIHNVIDYLIKSNIKLVFALHARAIAIATESREDFLKKFLDSPEFLKLVEELDDVTINSDYTFEDDNEEDE